MRSSVDFPHPEGPSRTRNSRSGTCSVTLPTAVLFPNVLLTRSSLIDAIAIAQSFVSALDAAGGHAGHHVALDEQVENDGRQRIHEADRHHRMNRRAQLAHEACESDRGGAQALVADERLSEKVFVPAMKEGDNRSGRERWSDQGYYDPEDDIHACATIDPRRLLDIDRDSVDRTLEDPGDDRNRECAVGEDQATQRVEQFQVCEDCVKRDYQHRFRQHLGDEEPEAHESHPSKPKAGQCVRRQNRESQTQDRCANRNDRAVPHPDCYGSAMERLGIDADLRRLRDQPCGIREELRRRSHRGDQHPVQRERSRTEQCEDRDHPEAVPPGAWMDQRCPLARSVRSVSRKYTMVTMIAIESPIMPTAAAWPRSR